MLQERMWDGFKLVIVDWEENTGNIFEVILIPGNQFKQVLNSRINAHKAPDIIKSEGFSYNNLLPPNFIAPLNDRSLVDRIVEPVLLLMEYSDGTIPYIPLVPLNGEGIAYNKKIFNDLGLEEPKNRFEFLKVY